jgi:RNA polymerase sigma-70 factor (sigma-E family)
VTPSTGASVGDERDPADPPHYQEFAAGRAAQLFRLAYLMCGDWHEAQDLVQTCLAKLYASWSRVQKVDSLDAYARRTLINSYMSHRRLRRSTELPIAEFTETQSLAADGSPELRMVLTSALASLPPRNRAVMVLRYFEDQSVEAVAELLDTTPSAIKSICNRSLKQLRGMLAADRELLFQD